MIDNLGGKSSEAVLKATGKNWQQWIKVLDKAKMKSRDHKEIAKWLYDNYGEQKRKDGITGWWAQSVTVGYELYHGKRTVGQTRETGYQIGVQKTYSITPQAAWELIVSPKGLKIWLGNISDFTPFAGYAYRTQEGISGEVRTIDKGKKLRLTWKLPDWRNVSTLQIYIVPTGKKTAINFHQEKLASSEQRTEMRKHWQAVLDNLVK